MITAPDEKRDFFVSFNQTDRAWATWIAWVLEEAGYSVWFQDWDFKGNFVLEMDKAHKLSRRTIAVLSPDYRTSRFTAPEWAARFEEDAASVHDLLIPVRVRECAVEGLLRPIVYVDLHETTRDQARERLLNRVQGIRLKPKEEPLFPGGAVPDAERSVPATPEPSFPLANHNLQEPPAAQLGKSRAKMGSENRPTRPEGRTLRLRISTTSAGRITTTVLSGPASGATAEAPYPFRTNGPGSKPMLRAALTEMEGGQALDLLSEEQKEWLAQQGWLPHGPGFQPVSGVQKKIGAVLFRCLFSAEETRKALSQMLQAGSGAVAYELLTGESDATAAQLPWELIHDGNDFCIRGGRGTLTRRIYGLPPRDCAASPEPRQLRVLLIAPRPQPSDEVPMLDDAEAHEVRRVGPALRVEYLRPPTFDNFIQELQTRRGAKLPDIIHFDGHGFFGRVCPAPGCGQVARTDDKQCRRCGGGLEEREKGYLIWEEPATGHPQYASGEALAEQVALRMDDPGAALQLFVLTACRSGSIGHRGGVYETVATRLIQANVPSVLAVQGDIEVTAARIFAKALYRTLAAGDSITTAVVEARSALWNNTQDWYRPAHYLRSDSAGGAIVQQLTIQPPWPKRALDEFIDQDRIVDAVERPVLFEQGLVTLKGPGGGGKSRVAREVARDLDRTAFWDGIHVVELAGVARTDPQEPCAALLRQLAFDLGLASSDLPSVLAFFRGKSALLVLDGFGDFSSAGNLIKELLEGTDGLSIMLTAELELHLESVKNQVREIPLLDVSKLGPDSTPREVEANCAVKLLLARVRPKNPRFSVTAANAAVIADIVRRLDGLPRAIELAAPFLQKGDPQAFRRDLVEKGIEVFDGRCDSEARRKTLRQTFELSYGRLSDADQVLFRRLAVFSGGFFREDAAAVCAVGGMTRQRVLNSVDSLSARSLLPYLGGERYRLRESGRQYAAGLLAQDAAREELEANHCAHFQKCASERKAQFLDGRQPEAIAWTTESYGNLQAAFTRLLRGNDRAAAGALALALGSYWYIRGLFGEGRRWLEQLQPLADGQTPVAHAELLDLLAVFRFHQSELDDAQKDLEHAIELAKGDDNVEARAYGHLGYVQLLIDRKNGGDYSKAVASFEKSESLYANNEWGLGWIKGDAGYAALLLGRDHLDEAKEKIDAALKLRKKSGDLWLQAMALHYQGLVAFEKINFKGAAELQEQCLAIAQDLGYSRGAALAHYDLAKALLAEEEDWARALANAKASLRLRREQGDRSGQLECLRLVVNIAVELAPAEAARLVGALQQLWPDYPDHRASPPDELRDTLKKKLPDAGERIAAGAQLDLHAAVKEALDVYT